MGRLIGAGVALGICAVVFVLSAAATGEPLKIAVTSIRGVRLSGVALTVTAGFGDVALGLTTRPNNPPIGGFSR